MADTESTLQSYISKYSGEEIDAILSKVEQLYNFLYESAPDELLYFLVSRNKVPQWDMVPEIEGVEI